MVESKQRSPTAQEFESLELPRGIMGDGLNVDVALSLLRRNDGNVNKTASAPLEGDTGDTIEPSVFAGMPNLEPVDSGIILLLCCACTSRLFPMENRP